MIFWCTIHVKCLKRSYWVSKDMYLIDLNIHVHCIHSRICCIELILLKFNLWFIWKSSLFDYTYMLVIVRYIDFFDVPFMWNVWREATECLKICIYLILTYMFTASLAEFAVLNLYYWNLIHDSYEKAVFEIILVCS